MRVTNDNVEEVLFRAPQHVFVYGTLKKSFYNSYILQDDTKALYCGDYTTKSSIYTMYSYGGFPAVSRVEQGGFKIKGELYIVTPDVLEEMDRLEFHPQWYKRHRVILDDGTWAFMYLIPEEDLTHLDKVAPTPSPEGVSYYQEWEKGSTKSNLVKVQ